MAIMSMVHCSQSALSHTNLGYVGYSNLHSRFVC